MWYLNKQLPWSKNSLHIYFELKIREFILPLNSMQGITGIKLKLHFGYYKAQRVLFFIIFTLRVWRGCIRDFVCRVASKMFCC